MDVQYFCAVKALILKGEKLLLIQRSTQARGDFYSWEFPGGALEFGETPVQAILREVKEETGLTVNCGMPVSTWTFTRHGTRQVIGITFLCELQDSDLITLSKEHLAFAWVDKSELNKYQLSNGLAEELQKWDWDLIRNLRFWGRSQ